MARKRASTKRIKCDQGCGKDIRVTDIQLEEEHLENKSLFYFRCPHCGHRYDSFYKADSGEIQKVGGNK